MVTTRSFVALGALLAVGLAAFGLLIGRAVKTGREFDRFLTVRGLSEREVTATLALWPLRFDVFAEELPALKSAMEHDQETVLKFLGAHEIAPGEVNLGVPHINDRAENIRQRERDGLPRYKATVTLVVRSTKVDHVKGALRDVAQLLDQGVRFATGGDYADRTQFLYEGVNEIKPSMIAEATANARAAAEKFAQDSKAKVGAIRRASQGVFEIEERDAASPELMMARVVTTVEFFIE